MFIAAGLLMYFAKVLAYLGLKKLSMAAIKANFNLATKIVLMKLDVKIQARKAVKNPDSQINDH